MNPNLRYSAKAAQFILPVLIAETLPKPAL
jgi:hypothetical protein